MLVLSKIVYSYVNASKFISPVVKVMQSEAFLLRPTFTIRLKCILDNISAFSKINPGWKSILRPFLKEWPLSFVRNTSKVTGDNMSSRWIQKQCVHTRSCWLNGTQNIRTRSYLVVVENDISNRLFVLIANKRRVKILEILRDLRGDSMIPENVRNILQVHALVNEPNFDKLCFSRKWWYAGK